MTFGSFINKVGDRIVEEFEFAPVAPLALEALRAHPEDGDAACEFFAEKLGELAIVEGNPDRINATFRRIVSKKKDKI